MSSYSDRINARRNGQAAGTRLAEGSGGITFWTTGVGQLMHAPGSGNTSYSGDVSGVTIGADKRLGDILIGMSAAYGGGTATSQATGGQASVNLAAFTTHGSWTDERFYVDGQLGLTYGQTDVSRWLVAVPMTATGNTGGLGVAGGVMVGARYEVDSVTVQPELGLRGDQLGRSALTESGAQSASLQVAGAGYTSARSLLGVRVQKAFELEQGYRVVPSARLYWAHEFADDGVSTSAAFTGAPQASMVSASARAGRDSAVIDLGVMVQTPWRLSAYAAVAVDAGRMTTGPAFQAGLQWAW